MLHVTSIHDARCNDDYSMLPLSRCMMLHATSPSGHFNPFHFPFFPFEDGP